MTDREGPAETTQAELRLFRTRESTTLQSQHQRIIDLDEGKGDVPFSAHFLKERTNDIYSTNKKLLKYFKLLEEKEEDEDLLHDDVMVKEDLMRTGCAAVTLCQNLMIWKTVSLLSESAAEALETVETIRAVDPTTDVSMCLPDIKEHINDIFAQMKNYTGPMTDPLWTNAKALRVRLVKANAKKGVEVKPITIVKSEYEQNFHIKKVNIPPFKGGLAPWHAFWGKYRTAVHSNPKLSEPVKLAVLIDLIEDESLSEYLIAANDGKDGRYQQIVDYLCSRFDRPRELHEIYCQKLAELPPNKGTPAELSKAADTVFAAVEGLRRSGQDTVDSIATSLVVSTLPKLLRTEWETKTEEDSKVPKIDQWIAFMRKKAINASQGQKGTHQAAVSKKTEKAHPKSSTKVYHNQSESNSVGEQAPPKPRNKPPRNTPKSCSLCSGAHYIFQCKQFLEMSVVQRKTHVQSAGLCSNCLRTGHKSQDCTCSFRCRLCQSVHNTLLHTDAAATTQVNHVLHVTNSDSKSPQTEHKMLMTSMVVVTGPLGQQLTVRAMLDSGAESSIISKRVMNTLKLQPTDWVNLSGIESANHTPVRPKVKLTISSTKGNWSKTITPVVLPKVTINLPRHELKVVKEMPHLQNLSLADPSFYQPRRVDMILDSDIFDEVLLPKKVTGPPGSPSAWDTVLGWGVMGRYQISMSNSAPPVSVNLNSVEESEGVRLDKSIERFWLMEELPKGVSILSPQESAVQKHFLSTHYYSPTAGRYVVTLPKKVTTQQLGDSFVTAKSRFIRNEASLLKKGIWEPFQTVVQEYITLGHAQLVTKAEMCTPICNTYHLPTYACCAQNLLDHNQVEGGF